MFAAYNACKLYVSMSYCNIGRYSPGNISEQVGWVRMGGATWVHVNDVDTSHKLS